MGRRILMTGASGFVGPYLRQALAARFPDAEITGLRSTREGTSSRAGTAVDLLDGPALAAAVRETKPDLILHLAAQSSVGRAQSDTDTTWRVNVTGTLNLALAAARHAPEATVLFTSSAEVYGGHFTAAPVTEATVPHPLNAYARSKAIAERLLADVLPSRSRLIVARPFNHTGAGQGDAFALPSFARQIARIERGEQEPCLRVGNLDAVRDFLDVRDVVEAYLALLVAGPELPTRVTVNISSARPVALRDVLAKLQGMARTAFRIEVDPARLRANDVPVALGDSGLLRLATGWAPRIPIEQTLADLLAAARAADRG